MIETSPSGNEGFVLNLLIILRIWKNGGTETTSFIIVEVTIHVGYCQDLSSSIIPRSVVMSASVVSLALLELRQGKENVVELCFDRVPILKLMSRFLEGWLVEVPRVTRRTIR
jgi:hypothetical protein